MKPECSKFSRAQGSDYQENVKSNRVTLQVLQKEAGDKENLVGGSRFPLANMKDGSNISDICEKTNLINKKLSEHIIPEGNLKKKNKKKAKTVSKSCQTDEVKIADEVKIPIIDLVSDEQPSENYWEVVAEKRRLALETTLIENETLHKKLKLLEKEYGQCKELLEEAKTMVEVLKEIVGESDEPEAGSSSD